MLCKSGPTCQPPHPSSSSRIGYVWVWSRQTWGLSLPDSISSGVPRASSIFSSSVIAVLTNPLPSGWQPKRYPKSMWKTTPFSVTIILSLCRSPAPYVEFRWREPQKSEHLAWHSMARQSRLILKVSTRTRRNAMTVDAARLWRKRVVALSNSPSLWTSRYFWRGFSCP